MKLTKQLLKKFIKEEKQKLIKKGALTEGFVWDRKFGESLPTLKQCEDRYNSKQVNEAKSGDDLSKMCGYIFDAVQAFNNEIKKHPQGKKNSKIKNMIKQLYKIEASLNDELRELE